MLEFTGGPGFLAFVATFVLVVGAVLLSRSLTKHLRKVRTHPPADTAAPSTLAQAAPTPASPAEPEAPQHS